MEEMARFAVSRLFSREGGHEGWKWCGGQDKETEPALRVDREGSLAKFRETEYHEEVN
jgi:hypothetical protein